MFSLTDKTVVVIGAACGIGKAIAWALAGQGAHVHCLDLDVDGATATAKSIQDEALQASFAVVDVRDSASIEASLADVVAEDDRLDVVVSTPGINIRKPMVEYSDEEYEHVTGVNLRGTFNVIRGAARLMMPVCRGSIIVTSSISATSIEPGQVLYAGTKAAIEQMTRVSAAELGRFGVRVNAIAPGPVETELTLSIRSDPDWFQAYTSKIALGRWAQPGEIAAAAVFLASDEASYVNGEVVTVHGGWTDLDPQLGGGASQS